MGGDEEIFEGPGGFKETASERKARFRSIWIVHFAMTIFSLGFSIVLTGVYPYMRQLLPVEEGLPADKEQEYWNSILAKYGWVVAINPLGQMLFSPILGVLCNKLGGIRLVCLATSVAYMLGNILYSILSIFPQDSRFILLLLSRFLVGASSANAAPMRSYVTNATFMKERTKHISYLSAAQSLGFIIGPTLQAAFTPIGCSEKIHEDTYIALDLYTICGWVSALFGLGTFVLFMPKVFSEFDVSAYELGGPVATPVAKEKEDGDSSDSEAIEAAPTGPPPPRVMPPPDYIAVAICLICFFIYYLNFVLVEALGTPLSLDEFGWTESEAILYMGLLLTVGAVFALGCFSSISWFSQKYDERMVLMFMGILPLIVTRLFLFPFPNTPSPASPENITELLGCDTDDKIMGQRLWWIDEGYSYDDLRPSVVDPRMSPSPDFRNVPCDQESDPPLCGYCWCTTQPALKLWQFILGFLTVFWGYPFTMALCQSIYSKNLGPRPMGMWMGLLTASGSFARVMGPIMVTYIYNYFGVYVTMGMIEVLMLVALSLTLIFWKRLVPFANTPAGRAMGMEAGAPGPDGAGDRRYTFGEIASISSMDDRFDNKHD